MSEDINSEVIHDLTVELCELQAENKRLKQIIDDLQIRRVQATASIKDLLDQVQAVQERLETVAHELVRYKYENEQLRGEVQSACQALQDEENETERLVIENERLRKALNLAEDYTSRNGHSQGDGTRGGMLLEAIEQALTPEEKKP